jgi:hypothetical protein
MLYELYTWDKLRELERQRRARLPGRLARPQAPRPLTLLARALGRLLTRTGAGLEDWAQPEPPGRRCCEACG